MKHADTVGGPQHGRVAVSALGSGRACPTAVIAFCPLGHSSVPSQCESCPGEQISCLWPLHLRAPQTLMGGGGTCVFLLKEPLGL